MQQVVIQAFWIGILSALSLPLGTVVSKFWRPGERMLAVLMAFGGGALLAALSIDLVGSALKHGQFWTLAIGSLIGSVIFIVLDQVVNNHGGFLRKSSTTITYLQNKRQQRLRRIIGHVGRLPVFENLPHEEAKELAGQVLTREYPAESLLYRKDDPSDRLYIIDEGEVELLDPRDQMNAFRKVGKNEVFGRMAFLTGCNHATVARTRSETRVWILPRSSFNQHLQHSEALAARLSAFLREPKVETYLRERHGLDEESIRSWVEHAATQAGRGESVDSAARECAYPGQLKRLAEHIGRVPMFQDLGAEDIQTIAKLAFRKQHEKGHAFFHQGEFADRMYIIEEGEVDLLDASATRRESETVHSGDAFGATAFVSGAKHSASAVARSDTAVWVLRRREFQELINQSPKIGTAVKDYLQSDEVRDYLSGRHHLSREAIEVWARDAVHRIEQGNLAPVAADLEKHVGTHGGAPIAIWLGILLDGIPESLVIGAGMTKEGLSLSLLAGLFLSNFPESLSSSVGMKDQGFSFRKILLMWTSLMLFVGIGAALGSLFFADASHEAHALIEGIAVGAMLTMIAQTMLPEAYLKGGSLVGISTLGGFLAAIFFKTLE